MGLGSIFRRLFGGGGLTVEELARRLDLSPDELREFHPVYSEFTIPKRPVGRRTICAPDGDTKALQRRILRRLLGRLRCHPAAMGFERGRSIVTNALPHAGKAVVVRMDVRSFFRSTTRRRVRDYFCAIGWDRKAARLLARLCTNRGCLPQGAPTSPRLSNLINYGLDARLAGLAARHDAAYTRYADDITFSFERDDRTAIRRIIRGTKSVLDQHGYALHMKHKLHIRRRHQQQTVTGLVVNEVVGLPRRTRRWLRAVEHHIATGREATLAPAQLAGWRALQDMIDAQAGAT